MAAYEAALESITYENTNNDDPTVGDRIITWTVNDGAIDSTPANSTITVSPVNDAPEIADAGDTLLYTEGDGVQVIDSTLTLTDVDDTHIESAVIQISGGYENLEDVLSFTDTINITGSWDATTGTLTLTGPDTLAAYEACLLYTSPSPRDATLSRMPSSA